MSADRQRELVNKLSENTELGLVEWKSTFDDDIFQVSFSKNNVRISKIDGQNGDDYHIKLINSEGKIVEDFSDMTLDSDTFDNISYFTKMRDLFNAARRKALGSDEVLDNIIEEIDSLLSF